MKGKFYFWLFIVLSNEMYNQYLIFSITSMAIKSVGLMTFDIQYTSCSPMKHSLKLTIQCPFVQSTQQTHRQCFLQPIFITNLIFHTMIQNNSFDNNNKSMQTAKPSLQTAKSSLKLKYQQYDFEMIIFGDQKLSLSVVDTAARKEYYERQLILTYIGCNTLIKACQNNKKEIRLDIVSKVESQNQLMQITVVVESAFLKPVAETLTLKKLRDISQAQSLRKAIEELSLKVKSIRQQGDKTSLAVYAGLNLETKVYASQSTYEPIASIKLSKGKYLLTFNMLMKATNTWGYVYFKQGEVLMTNCGFYVPNGQHFMPHTFRKVHTVNEESENVTFTTYCATSYPIQVRNAIITARKLPPE